MHVSANRAAQTCMSRDVTKQIVNRAEDPFNLTRHPKRVSGMLQALMLLTQCMTHTWLEELDACYTIQLL